MWLSSVYVKTVRDHRVAILGWGLGIGLIVVSPMASVAELVRTPEARAELVGLAQSFAWNADAAAVDTIGGYATFKIGIFVFLMAVWPLLAATRMLRGEEERGSLDVLLSLPRGRVRVALEKLAAMWTALLLMGLLIGLVAFAGGRGFGAEFGLGGALLFGLDLALLCAVVAGFGLLASQFTVEHGTAAGWTAAALLIAIVLDMVHRVIPGTEGISRVSPIYYYNVNKPLIPSVPVDTGALLVLLVAAVALSAAGIAIFARRDVGAAVRLPERMRPPARATSRAGLPTRDRTLGSLYARSLGMIAGATLWWTLAIAGFAGWMVVVVKQIQARMVDLFSQSPFMRDLIEKIGGADVNVNATFLSAIFQLLPILLMAFVVTQVSSWRSDEEDGRLELVLATPQPRLAVVLARFGALATATIVIGVVTLAVTAFGSTVGGLSLGGGYVAAASLGMIPLGLLIAGVGYMAAGWLRTAADTGLLSFLLAAWFFVSFIGPELKLPEASLRLSPFYYYGTPLIHGLPLANVAGLLAVGLGTLAVGAYRFVRKDIGV